MKTDLFDFCLDQAAYPFSGWNFDYLTQTGRMYSSPLRWNYYNLVISGWFTYPENIHLEPHSELSD
jgi:hypothetical protein